MIFTSGRQGGRREKRRAKKNKNAVQNETNKPALSRALE